MKRGPRPTEAGGGGFVIALAVAGILLLQAVVTYVNTNNDLIPAGGDYGLNYVFPDILQRLTTCMWDDYYGTGKPSVTSTMTLVWAQTVGAMAALGLSDWLVVRLVFFGFLALTNVAAFLFLRTVLIHEHGAKDDARAVLAALAGSWMYTFSVYVLALLHEPLYNYHFFIALLPLLLWLVDGNLRHGATAAGVSATALVLLLLSNTNPAQVLLILILALAYGVFFHLRRAADWRNAAVYIGGVAGMSVLLTAHIWVPLLGFAWKSGGENPYGDVGDLWPSLLFNSQRGQMLNLLLGTGHPWLHSMNYASVYLESRAVAISGLVLLLFALSTLLFRHAWRAKIFWVTVMAIGLFFAKGYQPPFAGFIKWLIEEAPVLGMYRATFHKFWVFVALALAVLASMAMADWFGAHAGRRRYALAALIVFVALIGINRYPFFSGAVLQKQYLIELPDDFRQLKRALADSNSDARVLALPATPRGSGTIHVWRNGHELLGPHILRYMDASYIDAAWFIQRQYFHTQPQDWWEGTGLEQHLAEVFDHAALLSIGRVFVQKDAPDVYQFSDGPTVTLNASKKADMTLAFLDRQRWAKKVLDTEHYALYEIAPERTLPPFYVARRLVLAM